MFQGHGGRRSKVFTEEEEIDLGREVLEETNGGKDLTWPKLSEIIQKKLESLVRRDPSREQANFSASDGHFLNISWVRRFAKRNKLSEFLIRKCNV